MYHISLVEIYDNYKVSNNLLSTAKPEEASLFMYTYLGKLKSDYWAATKNQVTPVEIEYVITPTQSMWESIEKQIGIKI
jgi:hypothetical protein